jgi:hypothetical protein
MSSMYDECVNNSALALMALGVPFCLLGVHWACGRLAFMGAQLVGNVSTSTQPAASGCPSLGGTGYCMAWEIYLLKLRAQHKWATFFSFSTSDLVYRSRHLLLAFCCLRTWPCIISYVFYYHHLDEIEEGLEKSERQKIRYLPQNPNVPRPRPDVQYVPEVGLLKVSSNALSDPQGSNWLALSILKQGAIRVDRLPQDLPGVGI